MVTIAEDWLPPSQDQLRDFYNRTADDHRLTYTYPWAQQRKTTTERMIRRELPVARMLDVGCGPGTYSVYAATIDPDVAVTGLDIAANALVLAVIHPRVRYVERSWDDNLSDLGRFGLCLLCEVLEHSVDPYGLMRRLRDQCDRFLVTVPLGWGVAADPFTRDGYGHLHSFDEQGARMLLGRVDHFDRDDRWAYLIGP